MTTLSTKNATLRARWIVPVSTEPVHNGMIEIAGGSVQAIGEFDGRTDVIDLGDVAILPGLVNAHTHLEFSDLARPIGSPGISISQWIPEVVRYRASQQTSSNVRAAAIKKGVAESLASGTRLLGEIATPPSSAEMYAVPCTGSDDAIIGGQGEIRIVAFCEVLGLSPERQQASLGWVDAQTIGESATSITWGISPHAPYSVPPALLGQCIQRARIAGLPLAIHLAESLEERRFIEHGDGPLRDAFELMNLPGLGQFPTGATIESFIDQIGKLSRGLLIHGNYLTEVEIDCLARHRDRLGVVYCPRTHAFFDHSPHPVAKLMEREIPVALGTDSRASNPDLNLWSEVRYLLAHRQDLRPESILRMATLGGADLLGQSRFGRLEPGCCAEFFMVETMAATEIEFWNDLALWRPVNL